MKSMGCCGRADGSSRPVTQVIQFAAVDSTTGETVGPPRSTFHEARVDARDLGPGHLVKTFHDDDAVALLQIDD